jgi:hypothetical protein
MLGYETAQVNSQLVNVAPGQAFAPLTFGSQYTGPGYWPRNGAYNAPPVMPSTSSIAGNSTMGSGGSVSVGGSSSGGHPMPSAGTITRDGGSNYFSLKSSPLIWAVGFLGVGLAMLHFIHYSK